MRKAPLTTAGAVLLAAGLIAGCSSGSSGGASKGGGNAGAGSGAQASAVAKAIGPGSSIMDTSKKACDGIKTADVQALLKAPATMAIEPYTCDWGSGKLTVTIYPNDTTGKYYDDGASNGGSDSQPLSVGDKAVWFQPVPGRTVPGIVSKKGTNTCTVQLSADPPDTTLTYTGSDPFFTIKPDDAASYAAKEGQLCTEVFSALG